MRGTSLPRIGVLAVACMAASGCASQPGGGADPPAVLPGPAAPPVSAEDPGGLTPEQQAEIDAAVAAYREANVQRRERASAPPPPPAAPSADPVERVSWLDPGGTGAGEPVVVAATEEPPAAPGSDAEPPPAPVVVQAAPLEVPELPPAAEDAGPAMVEIAALELCRSVGGFGVYEPFADTTFTAGAPVRMVLYTEIDGFGTDTSAAAEDAETLHRVRLEQEVLLFRDADGLVVWSREPEKIQDESRRRRRDFWSVQLIELPANLGVGRYRLKVRIADEVSGTVDERSVPLRLVADAG